MTKWILVLGLVAAVGCARAADIDEGVETDSETGGTATSGGSGSGGKESTGGKQEETGGTQGGDATGGKPADETGGKPADETGGTESTGGQGAAETGGSPPAGGVDEALYGKLELLYQSSGTAQVVLDLTNNTGRDLNTAGIEIRYWMTADGAVSDEVCECDTVQGAIKTCADVKFTFVEGPPTYLQITFDVPETYKFWGTTDQVSTIKGLQFRVHQKSYQNDDLTNDYSYQAKSGANEKVTVYYNGKLVWGVEPEG